LLAAGRLPGVMIPGIQIDMERLGTARTESLSITEYRCLSATERTKVRTLSLSATERDNVRTIVLSVAEKHGTGPFPSRKGLLYVL
jgi:hypothetical protein